VDQTIVDAPVDDQQDLDQAGAVEAVEVNKLGHHCTPVMAATPIARTKTITQAASQTSTMSRTVEGGGLVLVIGLSPQICQLSSQ
jgi:hypothetical protein